MNKKQTTTAPRPLFFVFSPRASCHVIVGILEFGSLGVSMPHLVSVLFGPFLVYMVAIFVVIHSFVILHHHKPVCPRLECNFPHSIPTETEMTNYLDNDKVVNPLKDEAAPLAGDRQSQDISPELAQAAFVIFWPNEQHIQVR